MNRGESVNSYNNKVKNLCFKLCNIYTSNKKQTRANIIRKRLKEPILTLCIEGFIEQIKVIAKTRNPKKIKKAKRIASTEELEFNV